AISAGGEVRVWDLSRPTSKPAPEDLVTPPLPPKYPALVRRFPGHRGAVSPVALSPDGPPALSVSSGPVRLWGAGSGRLPRAFTLATGSGHSALAVTKDLSRLATLEKGLVRLWDVEVGKELKQFPGHDGAAPSLALSPDGRYLVSGTGVTRIDN